MSEELENKELDFFESNVNGIWLTNYNYLFTSDGMQLFDCNDLELLSTEE